MHEISRRAFIGGSAAVLLLSGCSPQPNSASQSGEGFPVQITHHFGTTTIDSKPKRVLAVGPASADLCVALGVVPVLIPTSEARDFRTTAWFDTALAKLKAALPETYHDDEFPIRQFERFRPDLILAVNSSITRDQYKRLSAIAPVVAYSDEPGNTEWRTSTRMAATALGVNKADDVIAATEKIIADAARPFADFSALTGMFFAARGISGAAFEVYGAETNPQRIMEDYGIAVAPSLLSFESEGVIKPTGTYELTPRDARTVISDIYVASVREDEREAIKHEDTFRAFPGFTEGRGIVLDYETDALALLEASPLSVASAAKNIISEFARVNFVMNGAS